MKKTQTNIEDILPLVPVQEGILYHHLTNQDKGYYIEQLFINISGHLEIRYFEKAWQTVTESNEMLRTTFRWKRLRTPLQVILKTHKTNINYYDISYKDEEAKNQKLEELKNRDRYHHFDIHKVPFKVTLYRLKKQQYIMIITSHHILYDGWSSGIIVKEFFAAYNCFIKGEKPEKPKKKKFKEYVKWISQHGKAKESQFWKNYFSGWDSESERLIGKDELNNKDQKEEGFGSWNTKININTFEKLDLFLKKHKVTAATLLYSASGILLQKYMNSNDVILGTTVSLRPTEIEGIEEMVGLFINTLPFRLRVQQQSAEKCLKLIHRVQNDIQIREAFKNTPLADIIQYSGLAGDETLFEILVTIENYPIDTNSINTISDLSIDSFYMKEQPHYPLALTFLFHEEIEINCTYNLNLFDQEKVIRLCRHLERILDQILEGPESDISDLEIITPQEKRQILLEFNCKEPGYSGSQTIHHLFIEQVQQTPEHIALVGPNNKKPFITDKSENLIDHSHTNEEITLSYGKLNENIQELTNLLRKKGIEQGAIVGIMMERSIELVIGILAILNAEAAYLPIDSLYPLDRIRYIINDSNITHLIKSPGIHPHLALFDYEPPFTIQTSLGNDEANQKFSQTTQAVSQVATNKDETHAYRYNLLVKNTFTTRSHLQKSLPLRNSNIKLAYVIYTSGSTGKPKGVMVNHTTVVNLISSLQENYPFKENDTFLLKTPIVFDVSISELFGWYPMSGKLVVLKRNGEKDPQELIDTITKHQITYINFVPSIFNGFLDFLLETKFFLKQNLKYIFLAGEAILPETVNKFRHLNQPVELENLYGPTEATVYSSQYSLAQWQNSNTVPIGKPLKGVHLYIVDKDMKLQVVGLPGELVISGYNLSRGYMNRPELTAEKFTFQSPVGYFRKNRHLTPLKSVPLRPTKRYNTAYNSEDQEFSDRINNFLNIDIPLYITGDLARWQADGNIEFLGRIDQQIKIRGYRVELQEIENCLIRLSPVKEAVVTIQKIKKYGANLCAYITTTNPPHNDSYLMSEIREELSKELPDYMVPDSIVMLKTLPISNTGKLDRKSLPKPNAATKNNYIAPRDEYERQLLKIWAEILEIETKKVGIDDNFFKMGGQSLKAIALVVRIHKIFNISIPIKIIFKQPTIRSLSRYIKDLELSKHSSIQAVEEKEYYPLTTSQKRFFILQQLDPSNISYNMPEVMLLEGYLEEKKFASVMDRMIDRHEMLRTSFHLIKGEPVQKVHTKPKFKLENFNLSKVEKAEIGKLLPIKKAAQKTGIPIPPRETPTRIKKTIRPFDLATPPLVRLGLINLSPKKHLLMFDMHHLISDGVSVGILIRDFLSLYNNLPVPSLKIRYRDYVQWQYSMGENKKIKSNNISPTVAETKDENLLKLPTDYARPPKKTYTGETLSFPISPTRTTTINNFCSTQGVTLYILLLSTYTLLLSKLSGQEVIAVGSPIAGRNHVDLENIIGLFLNILCLKNKIPADLPFLTFLDQVKKNTLDTFEKQDYQYHEMVENAAHAVDTGRNPLFDVMLVVQNMKLPKLQLEGLKITREIFENYTSKFDMTLYCQEKDHQLVFQLEYSTSLFRRQTINRFISYFQKIIEIVLTTPHIKISEIEILPHEERHQLLYTFNKTEIHYSEQNLVYEAFANQVDRTPAKVAIKSRNSQIPAKEINITYQKLNELSNRQANLLRTQGVKANKFVGIMMERSLNMVLGILSILKAGGTYLPIDPGYPAKRIVSMLQISGTSILLTEKNVFENNSIKALTQNQETQILIIEELKEKLKSYSSKNLKSVSGPADLIYVIFTSGSTGKPKGAGVYHSSFMNLINWFIREYRLTDRDTCLLLTSPSFDLTQKNFYAPLLIGGILCIPGINHFDPPRLLKEMSDYRVTWINCTPSMFYKLVEYEEANSYKRLSTICWIFLGGEPISLLMLKDWLKSPNRNGEIVNTYGPTECTDICASFPIQDPTAYYEKTIPVGKPIDNVRLFILARGLTLQPIGVAGELFIGGQGVGPGYINEPQLTSQKFIYHTFSHSTYHTHGQRLYRTGDLTKWQPNGNILFLGRIDFQVKVRGFRIELEEIENHFLKHPRIKEAIVIIRKDANGENQLCAYVVPNSKAVPDITRLQNFLAEELPAYMVPTAITTLEKMPLSPNGKVDRKALPEPQIIKEKRHKPPKNQIQKILVEIWSDVLGVEKRRIGIHDDFFQLGGHSLRAAALLSRVHKEFSKEIPIGEFFKAPTITAISKLLAVPEKSLYSSIEPVEKKEYYPLSSAQKRLWVIQRMKNNDTSYNIPSSVIITGKLEKSLCSAALHQLTNRHESLRTSFHVLEEEPVQKIHESVDIQIENLHYNSTPNHLKKFVRPFDLSHAPLLRVGLINLSSEKVNQANRYILLVDMHHIISDGLSMNIFISEFSSFYRGETLSPLSIQYKDFSQWQNLLLKGDKLKPQEEYWLRNFKSEIPLLNLPNDKTSPKVQLHEGDQHKFQLESRQFHHIKQLAIKCGGTEFTVLLALFNLVLSKWSNQEDIVVGIPVAGRRYHELEPIIGMFVNTLALRNYPHGTKSFKLFLEEVKNNFWQALENQDYQYEMLVEKVVEERELNRNPLFDVMLVMQNMPAPKLEIPGLKIRQGEDKIHTSKFHLTLSVIEKKQTFEFIITYRKALFQKKSIHRFENYLKKAIETISLNLNQNLSAIDILPEEEKEFLLIGFNSTYQEYPNHETLCSLFSKQAQSQSNHIALVSQSIPNQRIDTPGTIHLSYNQLDEKSSQLAGSLKAHGIKPDMIVALMTKRSIEMIIGILGILKAGSAYLPIDTLSPWERIDFMLKDSGTIFLLKTTNVQLKSKEKKDAAETKPSPLKIIDIEVAINPTGEIQSFNPQVNPSQLAYILYTSGSTGRPKGVMVEHRNVINVVYWFGEVFQLGSKTHVLLMPDYTFDPSVNQIFGTLIRGGVLYIINKELLANSHRLRPWIEKQQIHLVYFVPGVLNSLLGSGKKLKSIQSVLSGGDRLDEKVKNNLKKKGYQLYNLYGPTETTIDALMEKCSSTKVMLGNPIFNVQCYILDRYNQISPLGTPGELCIGGTGVSRGYLNRPELTLEKFINHREIALFMSNIPSPCKNFSKPYLSIYKTGDLARQNPNGKIEFLGRMDHQVKIRGFRIELEEIQNHLMAMEHINQAVVIAKENPQGDRYIYGYTVSNKSLLFSEIKEALSKKLPGYMLPAGIIPLEKIPLTPNGKIDYNRLPEPGKIEKHEYTPPANQLEIKMQILWRGILEQEKEIGVLDNFFELGGHSLKAARLTAKIHQTFNTEISLAEIFKRPTIRKLTELIEKKSPQMYKAPLPQEDKEYYRLSPAQLRLFLLQQMNPESIAYNIPAAVTLEGQLDKNRLKENFEVLLRRHESFRTQFMMLKGEPVQKVLPEVKFIIKDIELKNKKNKEKEKYSLTSFIRPFDMNRAPLFRAGLIKTGANEHILVLDMHHIISDGISSGIIIREFMELLKGNELKPKKLRYRDYARWQLQKVWKQIIKAQESYWLRQFSGEPPVLNLPTDFVRPAIQQYEGNTLNFKVAAKTAKAIKTLALKTDTTVYMLLLSIFTIFLSKLSSQEEIVVGTPIAGRKYSDIEPIVGMFVNTLPLRTYPLGKLSIKDFISQIKKQTLNAFANQEYPFEKLVERLDTKRNTGRNPLFDTLFTYQELNNPELKVPGFKLKPFEIQNKISKFDLSLYVSYTQGLFKFSLEYSTRLFKEKTAKRFIKYFITLISNVVEITDSKLSEIQITDEAERRQLLKEFNDTDATYPREKNIMDLFSEQKEKQPNRCALIEPKNSDQSQYNINLSITYKELDQKSTVLAYILKNQGVEPETIVALMMERSVTMIVGLWGIIKAGGTYLPIEPTHPFERIKYILNQSNAGILLTDQEEIKKSFDYKNTIIKLPQALKSTTKPNRLNLSNRPVNDLAYIIYTSGSTGKPKGVMVEHHSLHNILWNLNRRYTCEKSNNYLFKTSIVFDVSLTEVLGWYWNGGRLTILETGGERDPQTILNTIALTRVTHVNFVPSMFNIFIECLTSKNLNLLSSMQYILLAGEALWPGLVTSFNKLNSGITLENLYGPTEATIYASACQLKAKDVSDIIPIGKPLENTKLYIFNPYDQLQPIGIPGELIIGGSGIARGYLNHPELTIEKFCPRPGNSFYKNRPLNPHKNILLTHAALYPLNRSAIYRTGDIARWRPRGDIEFLGRKDNQIKIRGNRIELGEIQHVLLMHENVKDAVVVTGGKPEGDEYLCAYIVYNNETSQANHRLKEFLSNRLPIYMIPAHFIAIKKLPVTLQGKIDKHALPPPSIGAQSITDPPPKDETEIKLKEIWSQVLEIKPEKIDTESNFFQLGGHSLKANKLAFRVQDNFKVKLPLLEIFKNPHLKSQSRYIRQAVGKRYYHIEPVEKKEYYPLSETQRRIYTLQQIDKDSIAYNMPTTVILDGEINIKRLESVFRQLIERHESLRTSFAAMEWGPVQLIHEPSKVEFQLETVNSPLKFIKPFDLSHPPLLRVGIKSQGENCHLLIIDLHHIISDGESMKILVEEAMSLYMGKPLPGLIIQYKDYSTWQKTRDAREIYKKQETYWLKIHERKTPKLKLPYDNEPPKSRTYSGQRYRFSLGNEETQALKKIARTESTTLYMVFLAIFNILLWKLSNQEEIVMGTVTAGRLYSRLEPVLGMFANTLALKNTPRPQKSFKHFLKMIKQTTMEALENQDFPFDRLVKALDLSGTAQGNPLFDVGFSWEISKVSKIQIPGLTLKPYDSKPGKVKFDMIWLGAEGDNQIELTVEYDSELFNEKTIENYSEYFKEIVTTVIKNKEITLGEIKLSHHLVAPKTQIPEVNLRF